MASWLFLSPCYCGRRQRAAGMSRFLSPYQLCSVRKSSERKGAGSSLRQVSDAPQCRWAQGVSAASKFHLGLKKGREINCSHSGHYAILSAVIEKGYFLCKTVFNERGYAQEKQNYYNLFHIINEHCNSSMFLIKYSPYYLIVGFCYFCCHCFIFHEKNLV